MNREKILKTHIEEMIDEYVKWYSDLQRYKFDNRHFLHFFEKMTETLWQILAYENASKWIYKKEDIINKSSEIWIIKERDLYLYIEEVNKWPFSYSLEESVAYKECIEKNHHYFLDDIKNLKSTYLTK